MPFPALAQERTRDALSELQAALSHHEQWCENLSRTLICTRVPDKRDLQEDAHRRCRFGRWLYGEGLRTIGRCASFSRIEAAHELLHLRAWTLLALSPAGGTVPLDDYDRFSATLKQMRAEVARTKRELESEIFNLDPLTGAPNRVGMLTQMRKQHNLVKRRAQRTCIAMIDLDYFKDVNDNYGHAAGDRVLCCFAQHMMSQIRPYDSFFRYGGEEFLFCAPNTDIEQGRAMVERLREGVAEMEIAGRAHPPLKVTASFGLALLDPEIPLEQSIERADKALYAAKAAGRNRTMIWDSSLAHSRGCRSRLAAGSAA